MLCLRYYPKYQGILKTLGRFGLTLQRTWGGNFKKETNSTSGDVSVVKTYIPTSIHKKSGKQFVKNYRPIYLLPVCSKLFEKILFKKHI